MIDEPAPEWDAIEKTEAGAVEDLEWIAPPARPAIAPLDVPRENRRAADLGAERAVLGSVLIDGPAVADALEHVQADDFSTPEHRATFGAMVRLYERGERPDVVASTSSWPAPAIPVTSRVWSAPCRPPLRRAGMPLWSQPPPKEGGYPRPPAASLRPPCTAPARMRYAGAWPS